MGGAHPQGTSVRYLSVVLGRQTVGVIFAVALLTATMGTGSSAGAAGTLAAPPDTPDASGTVWLCRPGLVNNPCTVNLDTTVVPARGPSKVRTAEPATNPAFDCFYIYPTVSRQRGDNANLDIKPAELGAVVAGLPVLPPLRRMGPDLSPTHRRLPGQGIRQRPFRR